MPSHPTVMDRLAGAEITGSPERHLVDAIRAWESGPQDVGLLDYTGLEPAELAEIVVGSCSVRELIDARLRATAAANAA
jgi:hypothetical protein